MSFLDFFLFPFNWVLKLLRHHFIDRLKTRARHIYPVTSAQSVLQLTRWTILKMLSHGSKLPTIKSMFSKQFLTTIIEYCSLNIHPGNILLKFSGDNVKISAILDWEAAWWQPEYWEFVKMMHGMKGIDIWRDLVGMTLDAMHEKEKEIDDQCQRIVGSAIRLSLLREYLCSISDGECIIEVTDVTLEVTTCRDAPTCLASRSSLPTH